MICPYCEKENKDNAKYCVYCGGEIVDAVAETASTRNSTSTIIDAIANIKHTGIATISYWTILFTKDAVYFCYMGGNPLPFGPGAFFDIIMSQKAKTKNQSLGEILEKSVRYYRFGGEQLKILEYKKSILGGQLIFPTDDSKKMKLKINSKRFGIFSKNMTKLIGNNN
ncbi:MAG: zinc ribbon domain-containing protein [Candidatus Gottesmanbacteria bacterium]